MRKIVIRIPESVARRIEKVEGLKGRDALARFAEDLLMSYFDDARRSQIETRKVQLGRNPEVYAGLDEHVGRKPGDQPVRSMGNAASTTRGATNPKEGPS